MRFSIFTVAACLSALSTAATIPVEARSEVDAPIEERQLITALVTAALTAGASTIGTAAAKAAIKAATGLIQNIGDWDEARQAFTQEATLQMWSAKPSADIVAVACYNKAYDVSDTTKISGLVSVDFKLGALHTDYDCMYLSGPVSFWTRSDGGFQNLCYRNSNACTYDSATGDLNCNPA